MKFELDETLRGATNEEMLDDLRRVAKALGKDTVTYGEYGQHGKGSSATLVRRFGSWNAALRSAGLSVKVERDISDDELFENLEQMWIQLGRQPRYVEIKYPFSRYSTQAYERRFKKFSNALRSFVEWVNVDQAAQSENDSVTEGGATETLTQGVTQTRRTRREISDRLRFRILLRDGFRCKSCGASPLKDSDVQLHVDHLLPWSKGGETTDDNLESKCKQCNLGKGNAFEA